MIHHEVKVGQTCEVKSALGHGPNSGEGLQFNNGIAGLCICEKSGAALNQTGPSLAIVLEEGVSYPMKS